MARTPAADARANERNTWLFERRLEGMTVRAISAAYEQTFGRPMSFQRVHELITEELATRKRYKQALVDEVRDLEDEKLERMERLVQSVIDNPPPLVTAKGDVVYDKDGNPVPLMAAILPAVDRGLRIAERRARLRGLDAPVRVESSGSVTYRFAGVDDGDIT